MSEERSGAPSDSNSASHSRARSRSRSRSRSTSLPTSARRQVSEANAAAPRAERHNSASDSKEVEENAQEAARSDARPAQTNAAGAAHLFSMILRRLQGGGGAGHDEDDDDDASGNEVEEAEPVNAGNIQQVLAGLQERGLLSLDEDGNVILRLEGDEEGGMDEDEDEEGEEEEEVDEEVGEEEVEEAQHEPVQHDAEAMNEYRSRHHLGSYPSSLLSNLNDLHRGYHTERSSNYRAHLVSHRIPSICTAEETFDGRAFVVKFSRGSESGLPSMCAAATQDGIVHLYETQTWKLYKEIEAREVGWAIVDMDFSVDSRFVIYSSWSDNVHLINTSGTYELHESLDFGHQRMRNTCMFGIRFSPDGSREIIAGLNGGFAILYDVERRQPLWQGLVHDDDVNSVTWLDSNLFATASDDASIKIFDRRLLRSEGGADGAPSSSRSSVAVGGFSGHLHGLTCVTAHPDGNGIHLLSNSKDQSLKLWDVRRMISPADVRNHARTLMSQQQDLDYRWQRFSRSALRASASRAMNGGRMNDQSIATFTGHQITQTLIRCEFSPLHTTNSRYAISGSADGSIFIYDLLHTDSQPIAAQLSGHDSIVRDVSWQGSSIVSCSWDHTVKRWSIHKEKLHDNESTIRSNAMRRDPFARRGRAIRRRRPHHAAAQELDELE